MAKGTSLVKSKQRYLKLITVFPEREAFYREQIAECDRKIKAAGVCLRCGRPLKDEAARQRGYGTECMKRKEAEDGTSESEELEQQ